MTLALFAGLMAICLSAGIAAATPIARRVVVGQAGSVGVRAARRRDGGRAR